MQELPEVSVIEHVNRWAAYFRDTIAKLSACNAFREHISAALLNYSF